MLSGRAWGVSRIRTGISPSANESSFSVISPSVFLLPHWLGRCSLLLLSRLKMRSCLEDYPDYSTGLAPALFNTLCLTCTAWTSRNIFSRAAWGRSWSCKGSQDLLGLGESKESPSRSLWSRCLKICCRHSSRTWRIHQSKLRRSLRIWSGKEGGQRPSILSASVARGCTYHLGFQLTTSTLVARSQHFHLRSAGQDAFLRTVPRQPAGLDLLASCWSSLGFWEPALLFRI